MDESVRGQGEASPALGGGYAFPAPAINPDDLERQLRESGVFVIGLTGPFGSGCTTAAHMLATGEPAYTRVKLSDVLRELDPSVLKDDRRDRLQDLGNRLRHEEGTYALVVRGLGKVLADDPTVSRIAVDGIRNLGEVRWLQRVLGDRFSLFAISVASAEERFARRRDAAQPWPEFYELDRRDQGETESWGQQVGRCVDHADVLIPNDRHLAEWEIDTILGEKVRGYAAIVEGRTQRYATANEMLMNIAYGASHGSKCLKRQVGAVIASGTEPLASGYNENSDGLSPCIEQFGLCYRDMIRHERFVELAVAGASCPYCGTPIPRPLPHPWDCPTCGKSLDAVFFPDRAMKWCTALHAEERAIINAGDRNLSQATLYCSTFPCMLCAEKIIHAGLRKVVYVDAYPDAHGQILFNESGVTVERFEGVRSRNFERYFAGTQAAMEERGLEKLRRVVGLP